MVEWTENNQKKKIISVPHDLYELGCIQDVEDGMKVSNASKSSEGPTSVSSTLLFCEYLHV